jgi:hypothetical protein
MQIQQEFVFTLLLKWNHCYTLVIDVTIEISMQPKLYFMRCILSRIEISSHTLQKQFSFLWRSGNLGFFDVSASSQDSDIYAFNLVFSIDFA